MTDAHWHPLALSRDVAPGTSAGVVVNGQEIVVWRDLSGTAHAWEDRCPHRGMKLSFGFVRGDHIACLYHGWEYGADGRCRYIPAHPDLEVPASICVPRHACAEGAGMIWAWLPGSAPAGTPPEADVTPVRSLFLDCPLDHALALAEADPPEGAASLVRPAPGLARLGAVQMGLHPVGGDRAALHLALVGAAPRARCLALADWAAALRRTAEAAPRREAAE